MKDKINEGDIVVYHTDRRIEIGRVARIDEGQETCHIVPVVLSSYVKKRRLSEILSIKKINSVCKNL